MASTPPTLAELAARVAELEARDARVAALGKGPRAVELATADLEAPMRTVYEVRSALTGAVVGTHELETDAQAEVDRLNDECRREGIKQRGEPMSYELAAAHRPDARAAHEQHLDALAAAEKNTSDADELAALQEARESVELSLANLDESATDA